MALRRNITKKIHETINFCIEHAPSIQTTGFAGGYVFVP